MTNASLAAVEALILPARLFSPKNIIDIVRLVAKGQFYHANFFKILSSGIIDKCCGNYSSHSDEEKKFQEKEESQVHDKLLSQKNPQMNCGQLQLQMKFLIKLPTLKTISGEPLMTVGFAVEEERVQQP